MKNNVNLDKAFSEMRKYPGARTDRKVFKTIADYANDKGVAMVRQKTIAAAADLEQFDVSESVHRLADRGLVSIKADYDGLGRQQDTYEIASDYMDDAGDAASVSDLAQHMDILAVGVLFAQKTVIQHGDRIDDLAKRIARLEDAIAADNKKTTKQQ